ncbi:MAG: rhomboid family intramembrane serine protease [Bacteroidota bacterium]
MSICWGYSPKIEKSIPLGDLAVEQYLRIAKQAMTNLGWSLSHISERGIIAYTPISLQSYSEEIALRFDGNFVVFKSECVGIQMLFNDYGKNAQNLARFINEFGYAKVQVDEVWDGNQDSIVIEDSDYFEKTPLAGKNKIKNVFYLLIPQENYVATPIFIFLNIAYYVSYSLFMAIFYRHLVLAKFLDPELLGYYIGANSREFVLNGQYWRLITHQFSHLSFFHLFFNMYALAYIGLMVEYKLGFKKYVSTYIISGVCGGLVSLMFHDSGFMTGASGAIMGLFGAFLALLLGKAFERNAAKALLTSTLAVLSIMLIGGALKKNVDNAAHLGGLISGFISSYLLYNGKFLSSKLRYAIVISLVLVFAVVVLKYTPKIQTKEFAALEKKYKQNWAKYTAVYKIPHDLPTGRKLTIVQEKGIDVWKENDLLVKQMLALKLTKQQRFKAEFHAKVVEIQSKIVVLFYKECAESTKYYRREIRELTRELNALRVETERD